MLAGCSRRGGGWQAGACAQPQSPHPSLQHGLGCPSGWGEGSPRSWFCPQPFLGSWAGAFSQLHPKLEPLLGDLGQTPALGELAAPRQTFFGPGQSVLRGWLCLLGPPKPRLFPVCHCCHSIPATQFFCLCRWGGDPGGTVSPFEARAVVDQVSQAGPSAGSGQGPQFSGLQ